MAKRNRLPILESDIFAMRGSRVKWPTLRGSYLTDETVAKIKKSAFGVIFLDGPYNTRLNFGNEGPYTLDTDEGTERAIFFEHLHKVDGGPIFLLCWIGNYYAGSIFHCAWQFPQMYHWNWKDLERAAFKTYKTIATVLECEDPEVLEFLG